MNQNPQTYSWSSKPVRNVDWETDDATGFAVLIKPKFPAAILRWIRPLLIRGENFRIKLDDVGTQIWQNCDGNQTLEEISEKLVGHFGERIQPVEERLGMFVSQLMRSGFISFPQDEAF